MNIKHCKTPLWVATVAAVSIAGCTNGVNLRPAPSTAQGGGRADNKVVYTVDNVTVMVKTNTWSGNSDVLRDVTPLRVNIQNQGPVPIRISYDNLALVADSGQRYSALPPLRIRGTVDRKVTTNVGSPGFGYSGFSVAPAYGAAYSGISTYGGGFGYGNAGSYNNFYYDRWKTINVNLPTQHMRKVAVPEGVLKPGGHLDGYLYFEEVPTNVLDRLHFRADLINAKTGERLGEISIPFVTLNDNG